MCIISRYLFGKDLFGVYWHQGHPFELPMLEWNVNGWELLNEIDVNDVLTFSPIQSLVNATYLIMKVKIALMVIAIQTFQDFYGEYKHEFLASLWDYSVTMLNLCIGIIVGLGFHKSMFHVLPKTDEIHNYVNIMMNYIPKTIEIIL